MIVRSTARILLQPFQVIGVPRDQMQPVRGLRNKVVIISRRRSAGNRCDQFCGDRTESTSQPQLGFARTGDRKRVPTRFGRCQDRSKTLASVTGGRDGIADPNGKSAGGDLGIGRQVVYVRRR